MSSSIPAKVNLKRATSIVELSKELFPRCAFLKYYPLVVAECKGSKVVDIDGNRYIDFVSGTNVFNIGHLHERVIEYLKRQLEKYVSFPLVYFYSEEPCFLARKLVQITPGSFKKKIIFGFSGSDAVDTALNIARAYTGRRCIVAFKGSFHGSTYLSMSSTGLYSETVRKMFKLSSDVLFAEYPNPYRNPWNIDGYEDPVELSNLALDTVEKAVKSAGGDVAAVLFEPVQVDGGVVVPPKYFVANLVKLAREHGAIFIDDEVSTGLGRTGSWWAIEHFSVEPDILVVGKPLGGGLPLSAVVGRSEVLDSIPPLGLSFTLAGYALSIVASLATIEVLESERLVERAITLGTYALRRLKDLADRIDVVGDVRGIGMLMGVELVSSKESRSPSRPLALKTVWRAWEKGVLLLTAGAHGNVVRVSPPLNIPLEDLEKGLEVLENAVIEVKRGEVPDIVLDYMTGW